MSGINWGTTNGKNCTLNLIARTIASSCSNMDLFGVFFPRDHTP
jgi:hypothetical protein